MLDYQLKEELKKYIEDNYIPDEGKKDLSVRNSRIFGSNFSFPLFDEEDKETCVCFDKVDIDDIELDESFSDMLLRKIDEKGMSDVQCYSKANTDRRLFSKIRSDKNYRPSKQTAWRFAIALNLSLKETEELLRKAGYAISHSRKEDVIVEWFINKKMYDLSLIDETLLENDFKPLSNY